MKVGYVVLYVRDEKESLEFWTKHVGMEVKQAFDAGEFKINRIGFANQDFSFELVPLKLMAENKDNLNLGCPSICFRADDLAELRKKLISKGVNATEISEHFGMKNFAFSDKENNWFAVM